METLARNSSSLSFLFTSSAIMEVCIINGFCLARYKEYQLQDYSSWFLKQVSTCLYAKFEAAGYRKASFLTIIVVISHA